MGSLAMLKKVLNSLIITERDGVPIRKLYGMYKELEGREIPYRDHGFSNLDDFMASLTDIAYLTRDKEGQPVYMAVANQSNAHIQRMIKAQRPKRKKTKGYNLRRPTKPMRQFHSPFPQRIQASRGGYRPPTAGRKPGQYQPRGRSGYAVPNMNTNTYHQPVISGRPYPDFRVNRPVMRAAQEATASTSSAQGDVSDSRFARSYEVPPRFRRMVPPSQGNVPVPQSVALPTKDSRDTRTVVFAPASLEDTKQYKNMLHTYVSRNKLGSLEYDTMMWKNNGFVSSVNIRGDIYNSIVNYKSKQEAEQAAAKNACEKLGILSDPSLLELVEKASSSSSESGRTSPDSIVVPNEAVVKERVKTILQKRPNGLWHTRLPVEYRDTYKEDLPTEVMEVLERWPNIVRVERLPTTERKILYPVKEEESLNFPDALLPSIGSTFSAFLCHIWDPGQFYVQREDSPYVDLQTMLNDTFKEGSSRPPCVKDPEIGSYCVSQYGEESDWYRARVIGSHFSDSGSQSQYDIFYCDYGNLEKKDAKAIMQITGALCKEPAQAIKCSLHGAYPSKTSGWTDEAIAYFNEMNDNEVQLMLTVVENLDDCVSVEMKRVDNSAQVRDVMIEKGLALSAAIPELTEPEPLYLPDTNQWDIYVSYINTSCDIIVRLVDEEYSEKLDELQEQMLAQCTEPVSEPEINRVYAQMPDPDEQDNEWIRARVTSLAGNDRVMVAYVDHGGEETVAISTLRQLPAGLNTLPYQAVKCSLDGLELQQNNKKINQNLLDMVLGNTYVAVVKDRSDKISLTLWDTSSEREEININEKIAACLENEELAPRLPRVGGTIEGIVSHIEEDFFFFIIDGPGFQRLEKLNREISEYYSQPASAVHFVSNPQTGTLVVCKDSDGSWYRARIENVTQNRKVEVFYVDYGKQEEVSSNSLRAPLASNRLLSTLPHQAIKCKLFNLPPGQNGEWTEDALTRMEELITDKQLILEVVTAATESDPAEVELYFWEEEEMVGVSEVLIGEKVFGDVPIASAPGIEKLVLKAPQSPQQEEAPSSSTTRSPFETPAESPSQLQSEHSVQSPSSSTSELPVPSLSESYQSASESISRMPLSGQASSRSPSYFEQQSSLPSLSPVTSPPRPPSLNTTNPLDAPLPDDSMDSSEASSDMPSLMNDDPDALVEVVAEKIKESLQLQEQLAKSKHPVARVFPRTRDEGDSISPERASNDSGIEIYKKNEVAFPPPLSIPRLGETIDLHVIWVVSPFNFRCTPYEDREILEELITWMNSYYETERTEPPSDIKPGQLLACKSDNSWHRVTVNSLLPGAPGQVSRPKVSVNFVDRGVYNSADETDLRPLAPQFRELPFQAIKAKLADVAPPSPAGWSQAAIERFSELTMEHDFVGVIRDISESVLLVELFDTSDENQDVNIALELQKDGHAILNRSQLEDS